MEGTRGSLAEGVPAGPPSWVLQPCCLTGADAGEKKKEAGDELRGFSCSYQPVRFQHGRPRLLVHTPIPRHTANPAVDGALQWGRC